MFRYCIAPLVAFLLVCLVDAKQSNALVMIRDLKPGEVPNFVPKDVLPAIQKAKSIGGIEHDGFGWTTATIYCRGTHQEIQNLLDELSQSKSIELTVTLNRSGNAGILRPRKGAANQRIRWYVYRISIGKQNVFQNAKAAKNQPIQVNVTVRSVGGVRPDDLRWKQKSLTPEK